MFDISFSELMLIAVVALVVVGPERLPKVARMAGHLLGRVQRYVNEVKADINREIHLDELKKLQGDVKDSIQSFEKNLSMELESAEQSIEEVITPIKGLANDSPPSANQEKPSPLLEPEIVLPEYEYPSFSNKKTEEAPSSNSGKEQ